MTDNMEEARKIAISLGRDYEDVVERLATALADAEKRGEEKVPPALAVRVKPLEWAKTNDHDYRASNVFGMFRVVLYVGEDGWKVYGPLFKMRQEFDGVLFKSEDEAKAALQSSYEEMVRTLVEDAPAPAVQDGWRMVPKDTIARQSDLSGPTIMHCAVCGSDEASTYLGEPGPGIVRCFAVGCDAQVGGYATDDEAIAEWNRRAAAMDAAMAYAYCISDDDLTDCFRHHITTTIGWLAFGARPGPEMHMYEEGFKAGYRRWQADNEPELGEDDVKEDYDSMLAEARAVPDGWKLVPKSIHENLADIIAENPEKFGQAKDKMSLRGWFVGQTIKRTVEPVLKGFVERAVDKVFNAVPADAAPTQECGQ